MEWGGAWCPASKSLYQPGNYTSFRAISSTLAVEGGRRVVARVSVARTPTERVHHLARILSLRPPPRVGINCHSCLRRVINCRNLSCAGIIGAASKFPRERGGGERAFYLAIYNILRFSRSCRPSKQIRKFVETSYARISPIARDSGRCVTT